MIAFNGPFIQLEHCHTLLVWYIPILDYFNFVPLAVVWRIPTDLSHSVSMTFEDKFVFSAYFV